MLETSGLLFLFTFLVLVGLLLDLGLFNTKPRKIKNKEAVLWSLFWIGLSMVFSFYIYWDLGQEKFYQFQTAYWIEKTLSVDNLFVFVLVFKFFQVDTKHEHKVLFWGILGAVVLRAIFIFGGVEMVGFSYLPSFEFLGSNISVNVLLTLFGLILLIAGFKTLLVSEKAKSEFGKGWFVRQIRKVIPISRNFYADKFFIRFRGRIIATKLFLVLIVIESTDVLFAVDSVPAIFSIVPNDPYILYMSNIFAILGLRSLYFLLSNSMDKFAFLKYGLGIVLLFIGTKMLIDPIYHLESVYSLFFILTTLFTSVVFSLLIKRQS